jgi:hypothetical protein
MLSSALRPIIAFSAVNAFAADCDYGQAAPRLAFNYPPAPAALVTLRAHFTPKQKAEAGGRTTEHLDSLSGRVMGDIVNLRKARKKIERQLEERQAAANRLSHGRSKAERNAEAARKAKARRHVDQHQVETGDPR